jgi:hypothetical protein
MRKLRLREKMEFSLWSSTRKQSWNYNQIKSKFIFKPLLFHSPAS